MIKRISFFLLVLFLASIFFSSTINAQSDYVLPYPGSMPGSKLYKIHLVWEEIMKHWYFGSFGSFKYDLQQSDKYLVEAKTLFEYNQYLLAYNALKKSNMYFKNLQPALNKARNENKNITQKQNLLKNASLKHVDVLNSIIKIIPDRFVWNPEKSSSTKLELKKTIEESIKMRENLL